LGDDELRKHCFMPAAQKRGNDEETQGRDEDQQPGSGRAGQRKLELDHPERVRERGAQRLRCLHETSVDSLLCRRPMSAF
jgi:hypothetical protein